MAVLTPHDKHIDVNTPLDVITDPQVQHEYQVQYQPFNWYQPGTIEDAYEREWCVIRFTDWLCRVNSLLDVALPSCWTSHAWLILTMDSLYTAFIDSHKSESNPSDSIDWINSVTTVISQVNVWKDVTNHRSHTCPGADDNYSPSRQERRISEEDNGYRTGHTYLWPQNPLTTQEHLDQLMTQPILNNVTEE